MENGKLRNESYKGARARDERRGERGCGSRPDMFSLYSQSLWIASAKTGSAGFNINRNAAIILTKLSEIFCYYVRKNLFFFCVL